ncbi:acyl-CoA dehydrogenase family protein [Actinophytocola oryzae]|uniref:Alkylation response protein AidB-like acyl-CoA dehydrogenase n=1 Tax=Actinophytocola oryzae TaxID=502181 RepID=A0A4R7W1Q7_9PSEU|nr:acyl-CoA dehydrogenase family protein [Actinophytocola oryzae]TDV56510.1 alkylation response protein AidB-like acyl-CoA dehydrogenase [Actinophytocola oryzae]
MSTRDLVVETVRDILAAHEPFVLTPDRSWDAGLWSVLAEAGMTGVGLSEEAGGSGGALDDAAAVVTTLAAGAAAVPVAEQLLVAGPALLAAGLDLPIVTEPLTIAVAGTVLARPLDKGRFGLTGTATAVPWVGVARRAAVLATGPDSAVLALADLPDGAVGANLAGEPRGDVTFDDVPAVAAPVDAETVRARFALARAVQLAGALGKVLDWTVAYAGEREQFGRPLAKFQAVQMEIARMAGEVGAATALADAAVRVADTDGLVLAAAAAKIRAGAAVAPVARAAHQLHGAIGFTQEHRLHHLTRRLWAWRDEAGSELAWARTLGEAVATAPAGLWPTLTDVG